MRLRWGRFIIYPDMMDVIHVPIKLDVLHDTRKRGYKNTLMPSNIQHAIAASPAVPPLACRAASWTHRCGNILKNMWMKCDGNVHVGVSIRQKKAYGLPDVDGLRWIHKWFIYEIVFWLRLESAGWISPKYHHGLAYKSKGYGSMT